MIPKMNILSKPSTRLHVVLWFVIWCALIITSWYCRPLLPFQETLTAAISWEMWSTGNLLIPYSNGVINPQAPPLLNWMTIGLWHIFGVHEFLLRLSTTLLSFGTLLLTALAARQLWPHDRKIRTLAPLILIGSFVWILFATAHINQIALSFFQILCVNFLIRAWRYHCIWWLGFGGAFLLGLFSSGANFILYIVPLGLSFPFWNKNLKPRISTKKWLMYLFISTSCALFIFVLWAYIAYLSDPHVNMSRLLGFAQLFYKINDPIPIGFYLITIPFVLFPWALWPPIYHNLKHAKIDDPLLFCFYWAANMLLVALLVGGNPSTPLLPLYPVLAIIIAKIHKDQTAQKKDVLPVMLICLFSGLLLAFLPLLVAFKQLPQWINAVSPLWGIGLMIFSISLYLQAKSTRLHTLSLISIALVFAINFGIVRQSENFYNLNPAAQVLSYLERDKVQIIHLGRYQSQFNFAGQLTKPLIVIANSSILAEFKKTSRMNNFKKYQQTKVVFYPNILTQHIQDKADYWQVFRGTYLVIMPLKDFDSKDGLDDIDNLDVLDNINDIDTNGDFY
ncbi:hypothetical protein AwWohl_06220 [Gammaproteobacteria bacterium]|nr:hypothetical protein AwWohl_06220 [Gammaproteobacteria bacterium]